MTQIAIITDTDSSLPPAIAAECGIHQVPISIHFNGDTYAAGIELNDSGLFEKIAEYKRLPTTSAPCPADFISAYETAFAQGAEAIVCICVSSLVSATYQAAVMACEHFPGREIRVLDSANLSLSQGFMVLTAAEAAARNASLDEVVAQAQAAGQKVQSYVALSTLTYLALSGRVDKFVAGLANTLNIKPILAVRDGKLDLLEKVRTRKKAVDHIVTLTQKAAQSKKIKRLAVLHVNDLEGAAEMERLLRAFLPCPEKIMIAEFTPGLSVHTGPGVVGVSIQTD